MISIVGSKSSTALGAGLVAEQYLVRSIVSDRDITVRVMLPNGYGTNTTRYPVLYTLTGLSSPLDTFTEMSGLRSKMATKPMIVVGFDNDAQFNTVLDGSDSWYLDSPQIVRSQFTSFFRDELLAFIDNEYRTVTSKRGVTGFSMGAFGAMHYAAQCPEGTFNSVSGMSGAYLSYTRTASFLDPILGTKTAFPARWSAVDLENQFNARLAASFDFAPIFLMVGTTGDVETGSDAWDTYLDSTSITHTYTKIAGAHEFSTWHTMMGMTNGIVDYHWSKFNP